MKYLDLFSGYGGFSLGIQQAYDNRIDWKQKSNDEGLQSNGNISDSEGSTGDEWKQNPHCVGFSEIDKYAIQTYNKHFPTHKNYGDITKINASELPEFDFLCGGFPCQAFSIAGKRAGFEDTRGTLIYDVFRIIKEKHPRIVLLENVKGLLSHDSGRTFKTIITSLAELGYAVEWQVLNAKNFGVPQNRERVFIIGHLGGFGGRQVFPITGNDEVHTDENARAESRAKFNTIATNPKRKESNYIVAPAIRATEYKHGDNQTTIIEDFYPDRIREFDESPTLRGDRNGLKVKIETRIRRLTPTECERLMGLPDGWLDGVSDTQKYKLAGNGVVVNVVKEIIKRLI